MWYSMSRTGRAYDGGHDCPLCGAELSGVRRRTDSATSPMGPKSPAVEVVECPNCGEVIDGFRSH